MLGTVVSTEAFLLAPAIQAWASPGLNAGARKGPQANTAAKRLRMRQVEHFRPLFQSNFSHTFQSDQSLPRAFGFILCAACGSVVLLHAARVFDYFVVIEIAFMDN